jgi:hypothetical protein
MADSGRACTSFIWFHAGALSGGTGCATVDRRYRSYVYTEQWAGAATSTLCAGATPTGELRNITTVEMQRRCAAEHDCNGYVLKLRGNGRRTFLPYAKAGGLPLQRPSGRESGEVWATYRKQDLCGLPLLAPSAGAGPSAAPSTAASPSSAPLLEGMRSFAAEAWASQQASGHRQRPVADGVRRRLASLRNFSAARLPEAVRARRLPVFYPFCGADLLTAAGLFPGAPRYVLVSAMPVGDPACFVVQSRSWLT